MKVTVAGLQRLASIDIAIQVEIREAIGDTVRRRAPTLPQQTESSVRSARLLPNKAGSDRILSSLQCLPLSPRSDEICDSLRAWQHSTDDFMRAKNCEAVNGCRKHQFESISRRDELGPFEDGFDYEICKLARSQALAALRFKL